MTRRIRPAAELKPRGYVRWSLAALAAVYGTAEALHACPICFQAEDDATSAGVRAAVGVLFAVTVAVLGAIGTFAVRVARAQPATGRDRPVPGRPVPL
jgi:hypothetical protein